MTDSRGLSPGSIVFFLVGYTMQTLRPFRFSVGSLISCSAVLSIAILLHAERSFADDHPKGATIYKQLCASCHGPNGEGTEEAPQPLIGEKSVAQLARFIDKRMPKDDPKKCAGNDAEAVAAYIYEAFYSKHAQARNKPPRIELSRLTVRQYRNAVADLIGSFRTPGKWDEQRGLRGEYFKTRRLRNGERVLERIDPTVHFDFKEGGSIPGKVEPNEFAIRWQGSVLVPETGEYEFILKTENGARLWLNDTVRPLIDAWVKSGNQNEHRASIHLLGGRVYPLRLEFFKFKEKTASVSLLWKVPNRIVEVIPQRNLSPNRFPELYVVSTPFPPDDRSVGYERGTSISKAWDQATTEAALDVAGYIVANLRELAAVADNAPDRDARLREFCHRFAERAFRRPLTPEQKALYIERQFHDARVPELAVKRIILLVLKSPRFLYRELGGGQNAYDVASRLAFGMWDSLPDQELLKAAAAGRLSTPEQIARQAERMLTDLRTRSKLREFFLQWLKVDQVPDVAKDPKLFSEFTPAIVSDLRASLELFLEDVIGTDSSDFRQLLLAEDLYLNSRLARFYGVNLSSGEAFQKVRLDSGKRAGVLTHPYLLAAFAYTSTSSPIHRGVFLARSILGQSLRPPPEAFAPLAPDLHPDLTTRERVLLQTSPQACQSCHGMINPLGFTLENFDAVGRYRDREKGKPIDSTGSYQTRSGEIVKFAGVRDLARFLAGSEEVHMAFVEQLFHYLIKQPIRAFGSEKSAEFRGFFVRSDFNIRKLMVEMVAASAQLDQNTEARMSDQDSMERLVQAISATLGIIGF